MIVLATARAEPPFADDLIARWSTVADRHHAASRAEPSAQYHSLLARAGIRALLFSHTAQSDWQLQADSRGKLSAVDPTGGAGPAISISHTRGMIACGLTMVGALGVDVERHRPRAFNAIAEWGFGQEERRQIEAGQADAFYRIWTLREAMGKATGEGLALVTDGRDRTVGPDEGLWRQPVAGRTWVLGHFRTAPSISLACAVLVDGGEAAATPATVQWADLETIRREGPPT